jgi:hypothetical protein
MRTELGFPFELRSEERVQTPIGPIWEGVIVISREYYSKQNLDSLFRWYSASHPNLEDRIHLDVYTDPKNIKPKLLYTPVVPVTDEARDPNRRLVPYDVTFTRQGDGAASSGGENEWYIYSPDLDVPNRHRTVVLRGKDPFAKKNMMETWESGDRRWNLRIIVYELENAEPKGTYYTLQQSIVDPTYWDSVITWRQDERVDLPRQHLRIINDRVAYFFMGQVYAVTADGGHSWSLWSLDRDLADRSCCTMDLIREVSVEPDGKGFMFLKESGSLTTSDFGQHWR